MHNPATDFDALSRQVWEAWSRQWPGAAPVPAPAEPLPGMNGLKGYLEWMQQAAAAMTGKGSSHLPPLAANFTNWAMPGAGSMPSAGLDAWRGLLDMPAFGHTREQQAQQQAFMRALLDHQQATARYQELLARAQAQGAERLQRKVAEPGFQVDSLKAMYDLWVDAVEEAYAEVALSDEFREAYAAQGNTQMRIRQMQQQQMEQWCREVGLPTRSEVDTLGQRVQEVRRELRRMQAQPAGREAAGKTAAKTSRRSETSTKSATRAKGKAAPQTATRAKGKSAPQATTRVPRRPR